LQATVARLAFVHVTLEHGKQTLSVYRLKLEVAAGLEPAKTGFADQRLDHFGIATKPIQNLYPNLHQTLCNFIPKVIPKSGPNMPPQLLFTPHFPFATY
jgi:hypothetical protein